MDIDELLALPVVVDLRTAARAFGLGQDKAYTLAKRGEFPCRVERWGYEYKILRADLFRELGLDPAASPSSGHGSGHTEPPVAEPAGDRGSSEDKSVAGSAREHGQGEMTRVLYAALVAAARVLVEHADLS